MVVFQKSYKFLEPEKIRAYLVDYKDILGVFKVVFWPKMESRKGEVLPIVKTKNRVY